MNVDPTPVHLKGSTVDKRPLRQCAKCEADASQGGGVELGPARWICSACWKARNLKRGAS